MDDIVFEIRDTLTATTLEVRAANEIEKLRAEIEHLNGQCHTLLRENEALRAALEEAEIYFGDAWPDKIRAMTRTVYEQITREDKC